jgi:hypothetical protein
MMAFVRITLKDLKIILLSDHASRIKSCELLQPQLQVLPHVLYTAGLQFTPGDTV